MVALKPIPTKQAKNPMMTWKMVRWETHDDATLGLMLQEFPV
jgi:hypothetical protein